MAIRAIITGATGMVGEGVLLECLANPEVAQVLVINRKPGGLSHPKLREIIHRDFFDLAPIAAELAGYDACFFCLGVSSVRLSAADYRRTTQNLTLSLAQCLAGLNPEMNFCYVSGAGTDSTEQGRLGWARVKGATENALLRLLPNAYMFRPGALKATAGQKNLKRTYTYLAWLYPIVQRIYPQGVCTLQELGRAMINSATLGSAKRILEVRDIVQLARGGPAQ